MKRPDLEFTGEYLIPEKLPSIDWQDYQRHILRYLFASEYVKDKIVLDIACATGYGSYILAKKGCKMVIGGDIREDVLVYANFYYKDKNLHFVRLNCLKLPFSDDTFDIIVSLETIEHLMDPEKFLSECKRVLKSNGIFICSTPNRTIFSPYYAFLKGKTKLKFHTHEFYRKEFLKTLKKFYSQVTLFTQDYISIFKYLKHSLLGISDKIVSVIYRITLKFINKDFLRLFKLKINSILPFTIISPTKKEGFNISKLKDAERYIYISEEIISEFEERFAVKRFKRKLGGLPFEFIAVCYNCKEKLK